ncbi:hypothetical protein ABT354_23315 [Streptomyces sp. NPDC000594]|uniref:hypothetical protein n=1 Tax=Streptomyces sp. NPDC000594 TaxID=3154261 RepID=UPI00332DB782
MSPELPVSRDERLNRLRQRLRNGTPATSAGGRVEASKGARLLYGVMLHGAARLQAGLELTGLEEQLVRPVVQLLSEEEVGDFGRVYQEEAATRSQLLPETLAARPVSEGYSVEDLVRDLPGLREEIAAQANVSTVDLAALPPAGEDGAPAAPDSEEFQQGMAAYGYGATVVTASGPPSAEAAQERPPLQVDMTLPRFFCRHRSWEVSGSNEIYWALAAGADEGTRQESITRTYGDVDNGETHNLDANTVLFRGQVSKVLLVHIECWEEDEKVDPKLAETIRTIATGLKDTAEIMGVLPGGTPWELVTDFVAMLGTIGHLISEILAWLADDLLVHRTIAFDRAAMNLLADPVFTQPDVTWWFVAEAHFSLDIRGRYSQPSSNDIALSAHNASGWSAPSLPWPGAAKTPDAPALALHSGNLYCAARGMGDQIYISRRESDGRWTAFRQVPGISSKHAPALASFNGQLYLAVRLNSADNNASKAWLLSSAQGDSWSWVPTPGYCRTAPALAVHKNRLWLASFGGNNYRSLMVGSMGPGAEFWEGLKEWPAHESYSGPALASFNGQLHLAYRNPGDKICVTTRDDALNPATRWPAPTLLTGSTSDAPALAVRGTSLHCAVRGGDNIHLCNTTNTGWNTFTPVTPAGKTLSAPALATTGSDLNLVYRALH